MLRYPHLAALSVFLAGLCMSPATSPAADDRQRFASIIEVPSAGRSRPDQGPEIFGVTYPRSAPPDLVAPPQETASTLETPQPADEAGNLAEATAERGAASAAAAAEQRVAEMPVAKVPSASLRLEVDLSQQRLFIIENGELKHTWLISSGRPSTPTAQGSFRPQWASRMWYSRQYDFAPMPYAVFFNGGIAFHATTATGLLGRPASHGCIRLSLENARHLYEMIHRHSYARTEIKVFGSLKVAATAARKGKAASERRPRSAEKISASQLGTWSFF